MPGGVDCHAASRSRRPCATEGDPRADGWPGGRENRTQARERTRTVEKKKEETVGGILHWGREQGDDLEWFRKEIRTAYGGRAPKVLDPFAGGGAIPLEAMRLGCEVTAMDINPVAWFILKCTLEYPQKLAGQTLPLPGFALEDSQFMEAFLKEKKFKGEGLRTLMKQFGHGDNSSIQIDGLPQDDSITHADLAWQVRAWGRWVLAKARKDLAKYYPTYAAFEPLTPGMEYEPRSLQLLEVDEEGVAQVDPLNAEFDKGLSRGFTKSTLARQTDGGLSLGAYRDLQTVPGHVAPAQDALVVQKGTQARAADNGTGR